MASNKQISARIPKDLYQRFTDKLAKEGKQSGKVLKQLIEAYCNDTLPSGSDVVASSSGEDEAKKNDIDIKQLVADEVATATHHLEAKINQLESTISQMNEDTHTIIDKQEAIEGRLELVEDNQISLADREQFLEGLSCSLPLPIESDTNHIADGSNMVESSQTQDNSIDDSPPIADGSNMVEKRLTAKQVAILCGRTDKTIRNRTKGKAFGELVTMPDGKKYKFISNRPYEFAPSS